MCEIPRVIIPALFLTLAKGALLARLLLLPGFSFSWLFLLYFVFGSYVVVPSLAIVFDCTRSTPGIVYVPSMVLSAVYNMLQQY